MAFKPFKAPSLKSIASNNSFEEHSHEQAPPPKRRRLSPDAPHQRSHTQAQSHIGSRSVPGRTPLHPIENFRESESTANGQVQDESAVYFSALWRKFTQKKNKTWDDDGFIMIKDGQASLYDSKGRCLGASAASKSTDSGSTISVAGRDVEIGDSLSKKEFNNATGTSTSTDGRAVDSSQHHEATVGRKDKSVSSTSTAMTLKDRMRLQIASGKTAPKSSEGNPPLRTAPFKQPLKENTVLQQVPSEKPIPRHDPTAPGALVFKRPKRAPQGRQIVDVVLDPLLSSRLRDHQRQGIEFLYECVMGLRDFGGQGCILADDMGLGKTLQTIALLWTLIKQNPIHRAEPVVKKALIVCPVSLIQNWKKEFRKWLGRDKLGVLTLEDKGSRLSMFDGKNFKVLIVGYERLRNIAEDLTRGAGIDIVVCDEGHRLKTLKNKSAKAIETLNMSKRVILSGTPIQNDLSEFFAMANFVNDGCLGSYKAFVKDFENPIMKSRQPDATEDEIEKGQYASEELARTTSPFMLRRTADILAKYLPPKTEYVLFCKPTPEQARVYQEVTKSPMFQSALGSHESALQLITILKKLCNSPALMRPDRGNDESTTSTSLTTLNEMLPAGISRLYHNSFASKIRLLDELLQRIRTTTNDKVILVSNYTSTLNLMANLLDSSGGRYLRLDGSVPQGKRQGLVDEFNNSPPSICFAFLLSAKAGGVGLNLIGANRLVLFDVDWNPATDDQAMARIHREGQRKPCKIYRFLIKGGLEERIWQRQVVKRGLADSVMEGGSTRSNGPDMGSKGKHKAAFSTEELKDLFRLDESEGLRTHDLIGCNCNGSGEVDSASGVATPTQDSSHNNTDTDDAASDGKDEFLSAADIIKASDLTDRLIEKRERQIKSRRHPRQDDLDLAVEKHELKRYSHLDTSAFADVHEDEDSEKLANLEAGIDDSCLAHVLRLDKEIITGRIAYVFKRTTEPEADLQDKSGT